MLTFKCYICRDEIFDWDFDNKIVKRGKKGIVSLTGDSNPDRTAYLICDKCFERLRTDAICREENLSAIKDAIQSYTENEYEDGENSGLRQALGIIDNADSVLNVWE